MRIAALSSATGVSVATLKYYLREGLVHPGRATAVNQADYDDSHVRRVRLVRALLELGHLSIADVARVIAAVDDDAVPIHDAFGLAQDAMARPATPPIPPDDERLATARLMVDAFVDHHQLLVRPEAGVRDMLAGALVTLAEFGFVSFDPATPAPYDDGSGHAQFTAFVDFFRSMAARELDGVPDTDRTAQTEVTVVGTVAVEVAMSAIRRMALEDASHRRFGTDR
ncbi:MAG: MerR family transcriptional regulator [Acidimicrobiales bacterium]